MNLFLTNRKQKGDTETFCVQEPHRVLLGFGNRIHSPYLVFPGPM